MLSKDWPTVFKRIKKRNFSPFLSKIYKKYWAWKGHDGISVVDEDWDYLIILDACRYDAFEEVNWLEGNLQKKVSKAPGTPEWLRKNFTEYYGDIVYFSGSGFVSPDKSYGGFDSSEHFYHVEPLYLKDEFMEDGAPRPEDITDYVIENDDEHPNKRKIIHYCQPHDPFIGDIKMSLKNGDVDEEADYFRREDSWEAYCSNLERALKSVERLVENLEGKIVISADHGDCFGEHGLYRHFTGIYFDELVEVPWLVIDKGERPEIISEEKELDDIDI
jgi:hypothetical protein